MRPAALAPRILLTGKNGQLGSVLKNRLASLGTLVALGREDCDLADGAALRRCVQEFRPDIIVNAAAYTAVDRAEQDAATAYAVNAEAPRLLAEMAVRQGGMLLHYSTDYVFDGHKGTPYTEQDTTSPLNVYGASKRAGEEAIMATTPRHLILRTGWVVGAQGGNFAKTMLRLAAERENLRVVADQHGAPTSVEILADISIHILHQWWRAHSQGSAARAFPYGLYHASAQGRTTWHAYACHVIAWARAAGAPLKATPETVEAIATVDYPVAARRPANTLLNCDKLRTTFAVQLPAWQEGVAYLLPQLVSTLFPDLGQSGIAS